MTKALVIGQAEARRLWLRAQKLDLDEPFGSGPAAVASTVAHLGYVQIDTINVIERSHHHILQTRIPSYRRENLATAQSTDRTIFEYWTHALAYMPTADYRFFVAAMERPAGHAASELRGNQLGRLCRLDGAHSRRRAAIDPRLRR